ncbi:hypothetical protein [Poseidonocella sp. HB161398]|uniref:hypothetical protein n=1 Tax=Poseidonocella sp. HB161398 TaxID=2320855 RepID=UPI001107AE39|nr:hypothetical protein [Poseidonocella sp. HB161398]
MAGFVLLQAAAATAGVILVRGPDLWKPAGSSDIESPGAFRTPLRLSLPLLSGYLLLFALLMLFLSWLFGQPSDVFVADEVPDSLPAPVSVFLLASLATTFALGAAAATLRRSGEPAKALPVAGGSSAEEMEILAAKADRLAKRMHDLEARVLDRTETILDQEAAERALEARRQRLDSRLNALEQDIARAAEPHPPAGAAGNR